MQNRQILNALLYKSNKPQKLIKKIMVDYGIEVICFVLFMREC